MAVSAMVLVVLVVVSASVGWDVGGNMYKWDGLLVVARLCDWLCVGYGCLVLVVGFW